MMTASLLQLKELSGKYQVHCKALPVYNSVAAWMFSIIRRFPASRHEREGGKSEDE